MLIIPVNRGRKDAISCYRRADIIYGKRNVSVIPAVLVKKAAKANILHEAFASISISRIST